MNSNHADPLTGWVANLRLIATIAIVLFGWTLGTVPVHAQTGLQGDYYNNTTFSGTPTLTRTDGPVNFNWGNNSPASGINPTQYAVRWSGKFLSPITGSLYLYLISAGSATLNLNGQMIINNTIPHPPTLNYTLIRNLVAGTRYDLEMRLWKDASTTGGIALGWYILGGASGDIPASNLSLPLSDPPANLAATPQWTASCPVCGGMPMAHIVVTWDSKPGATAYNLYRDGMLLTSNLNTTKYVDMNVVSGQSYSYRVASVIPAGAGPQSNPVTAVAPSPPPMERSNLPAPTNLVTQGAWQGASPGVPVDRLTWDAVPGAIAYTVYQYGVPIASHVTSTSYTVGSDLWLSGLTYTVTAIDSQHRESLPSALTYAPGAQDPHQQPGWVPTLPEVPTHLAAVPDWNNGNPRIALTWYGAKMAYVYTVYRDGIKVRDNLWSPLYIDNNVQRGSTHTYTVSSVNIPWTTPVESAQSQSVTATALAADPTPATPGKVQITGVTANDDSAVLSFALVPGAVDYRAYNLAKPGNVKYSGGGLSLEMNGLDTVNGSDIVVEAVDKMGPYMVMDGSMIMSGMANAAPGQGDNVNGQGDPSNIPNVLARSAATHVTCTPTVLTGSQAFFDNFRTSQPFQRTTLPPAIAGGNQGDAVSGVCDYVQEFQNDKWVVRDYWGDTQNTRIFVMSNHFMDTLYDGGTPRTGIPIHNNNASLVMSPKATLDITGGKIAHVTFEVDGHFDARRWCEVVVADANDPFLHPGKLDGGLWPTQSGNEFRWQINAGNHQVSVYRGQNGQLTQTDVTQSTFNDSTYRIKWPNLPTLNGTKQDLDKRHKFDLYLSQNRYQIYEAGQLIKDGTLPAGATLPFNNVAVYFVHQVYHTGNDRPELTLYGPDETYWYRYRPWADERHWDNMGFEGVTAFPKNP